MTADKKETEEVAGPFRPDNAPTPETPCEECGEPLGEWWGVTKTLLDEAMIGSGRVVEYEALHSACWWKRNPDAQARHEQAMEHVRSVYRLERRSKDERARMAAERAAKVKKTGVA